MAYETPDHNMEMPTPCQKCGGWFDLNDGYGSEKWFPNTVICEDCYNEEEKEIRLDEQMEEVTDRISELEWDIEENTKELNRLKEELKTLQNQ